MQRRCRHDDASNYTLQEFIEKLPQEEIVRLLQNSPQSESG